MPNNPYTPENIEKRLNTRSNSIILPQVTSLQRRNSYRREIDPNEIEDTASIKSIESTQSHNSTNQQNAVWQMFEDIVQNYSTPPQEDKWTKKYSKKFDLGKAQSCVSLIESEKKDTLNLEHPERSSSTSPGGVYLKDAYASEDDVKR